MITQPDASGGAGSFGAGLWDVVTSGFKLAAAGELSKRYGFAFGADGQVAVNENGELRYAQAPGSDVSTADRLATTFSNPLVIVGALAVLALVIVVARK